MDRKKSREILAKILGYEMDASSEILPPFYVDYGKNIKIGKNVWIQPGCTFMDRGGITLGDNVFIAPKVNLVTLNHPLDQAERYRMQAHRHRGRRMDRDQLHRPSSGYHREELRRCRQFPGEPRPAAQCGGGGESCEDIQEDRRIGAFLPPFRGGLAPF